MTPAVKALERARIAFELSQFDPDPRAASYGLAAAEALGVDPAIVYKTLLVELDGRELVVAIVPVSTTLDLKAVAKTFRAKRAVMAKAEDAERATGYVLGGISPFGQKKRLRCVLDDGALALSTMHVSGGRRGLEIAIAPTDLIAVTAATTDGIARP